MGWAGQFLLREKSSTQASEIFFNVQFSPLSNTFQFLSSAGAPNRLAAAWCNGRRCKGEHAEQERRPAAGGAAVPDGGGGRSSGGTVKPAEQERRVRACRCAAV
uniref:Uncharacterized protein n=1 Tax=Setaria italica TaxID=4555 RepID=K3ZYB9_SETIT